MEGTNFSSLGCGKKGEPKFLRSSTKDFTDVTKLSLLNVSSFSFSLLECLSNLSRKVGCYKTTLNCPEELASFCANMQFTEEAGQNFMLANIDEPGNFKFSQTLENT